MFWLRYCYSPFQQRYQWPPVLNELFLKLMWYLLWIDLSVQICSLPCFYITLQLHINEDFNSCNLNVFYLAESINTPFQWTKAGISTWLNIPGITIINDHSLVTRWPCAICQQSLATRTGMLVFFLHSRCAQLVNIWLSMICIIQSCLCHLTLAIVIGRMSNVMMSLVHVVQSQSQLAGTLGLSKKFTRRCAGLSLLNVW